MPETKRSHTAAVLQALFVTFLWSTSWVLIKIGLKGSLPALTFAGLRYILAFACLAPFVLLQPKQRTALQSLTRHEWLRLVLLGLILYAVTQGAQFLSLAYLPAAMVSLLLNLTSGVVALAGLVWLRERPAPGQWAGIALCLAGVALYFFPAALPSGQVGGLIVALVGVLANAGSSVLGRHINQQPHSSPLVNTFVSMGFGALLLLGTGMLTQGLGRLTGTQWGIVAWLAVVNTAFAFTLWNHTLRTLSAVESSILNGLMLPQITLLALVFLAEPVSLKQAAGLGLVATGAVVVQLCRRKSPAAKQKLLS